MSYISNNSPDVAFTTKDYDYILVPLKLITLTKSFLMKSSLSLLKTLAVLFSFGFITSYAQNNKPVQFKTGDFILDNNSVSTMSYDTDELVNGNYYRLIQFSTIPSTEEKEELKDEGIELLNYIPTNAFYASINTGADLGKLLAINAISVNRITSNFKLNKVLASGNYPKWALVGNDVIELNAIYFANLPKEQVLNKLNRYGVKVTMSNDANIVRFQIKKSRLTDLYSQPEFYYFEELSEPGKPEGIEDRSNHRSNTIATDYLGGLKFDGTGVTLMLQDNSTLDEHIDYTGRFFNHPSATQSGDHGEHTGGIIGSAGNLDPKGRGMAYGADILVYGSSNNNYNDVPALYLSDDLTITSKSYGDGANAGYTALAQQLDQQVRTMPSLIHVFSCGNSGSGWSTITGGHKQGKNVVAVGALEYTDALVGFSSRGPALDGRIKPDICAVGSNVYSTLDPNTYQNNSGTSMSCPGVAGTLAQLYHAYKTQNAGANPNSALMKASILNTAEDLGNAGPDYEYGWGRINARRAYELVNDNNYFSDAISQGGNNTHVINVPAGTTQLRVMTYWSDYEGAASASPALVNNLNMQVDDPSVTTFDPWLLNPASPGNSAVTGVDNLNNMEQVVIDNPAVGAYTVSVDGFAVPQGPQDYYVVYEFIRDEVVLTYPIGREGFNPGDVETIRWDSYGGSGTFNLEYSIDNGGVWTSIDPSVNSSLRYYDWTVPNDLSGEVLVRVTRGAFSGISDAVFSIIPTPINLVVDWACPDSMQLSWDPVVGATSYEVSMLGAKYMDSVGVSPTTSYVFYGVNPTLTYWLSVRAHGPTNARGERAFAIEKAPGTFNCPITIDAGLSGLDPLEDAQFMDCMISNIDVSLAIKNEGTSSISNVPVHYTLNGGGAVNEIYAGPLAAGATFNYVFTVQASPTIGVNNLLVWSDISGDGNSFNDSVTSQFTYIGATVRSLPWTEDFESFALCGTSSNCELGTCLMYNDFINETNGSVDDIDWRTDQSGSPSGNTGPGDGSDSGQPDFNPGTASGNYLYLEASNGCNGQVAELISPCIDLTTAINPELIFAYSMFGGNMGSLSLDLFSNGSWTNNIMVTLSGNKGQGWFQQTVDLSAYVGNIINLRYRGTTGSGYASDMAIDDINVTDLVGVNELSNNLKFNIYPNPSNGLYNYSYLGEEDLTIELFDVHGKVIYSNFISKNTTAKDGVINIEKYANGIYMILLTTEGSRLTKKMIKQ